MDDDDDGGFDIPAPRRSGGLSSLGRTAAAQPAASSRLASLFAKDTEASAVGNSSLQYKPIKQNPTAAAPTTPKLQPVSSQSAASAQLQLIHASPVQLYRFDASGQSQDLGRRGCALLGSPAVFQLLLYEPTTKVQDVKCALTSAFQCVMSGTEYVSFYDEQQQYWSLRFDNVEGALMFARFIALIRESAARAAGEAESLVVQELVPGAANTPGIAVGDQVKVSYRMYLCSESLPRSLGNLVGTVGEGDKPKTVKVGDGKELAGIEHGLMGMRRMGTRCLVLPPNFAYGAQGAPPQIAPGATLLVELTVLKVRGAADSEQQQQQQQQQQYQQPAQQQPAQQQSVESAENNDLKTRMAKLAGGRSLFGGPGAAAPEVSQQSYQAESTPQPQDNGGSYSYSASNSAYQQQPQTQPQVQPQSQPQAQAQAAPQQQAQVQPEVVPAKAAPEPVINSAQLTAIDSKLDKLHTLMEQVSTNISNTNNANTSSVAGMTGASMIQLLQNLVAEKDSALRAAADAAEKVASMQSKLVEAQEKARKSADEQAKLLESQFASVQVETETRQKHILDLQSEKHKLSSELNEIKIQNNDLQFKLQAMEQQMTRQRNADNDKSQAMSQVLTLQNELSASELKFTQLQLELQAETRKSGQVNEQLLQLQGEFAAATAQHQQLASQLSAQVQQLQVQQSEADAQFQRDKTALQTEWTSRVEQLEADLKAANKMLSRAQAEKSMVAESQTQLEQSLVAETQSFKTQIEQQTKEIDSLKLQLQQSLDQHAAALKDEYQKGVSAGVDQGSSETAALAKEQAREREKKIIATAQSNIDELQQQVAALETEKSELVDQTKAYVAKVREQNDVKTKEMVQKVMNRVYEVVASEVEKKPQCANSDFLLIAKQSLKLVTRMAMDNPAMLDQPVEEAAPETASQAAPASVEITQTEAPVDAQPAAEVSAAPVVEVAEAAEPVSESVSVVDSTADNATVATQAPANETGKKSKKKK